MTEYKSFVKRINETQKLDCFVRSNETDTSYLKTLNLPKDILDFYIENNPKKTIEINGIRLLSISEIKEENDDYTPGYILFPQGYCVIATTIFGDVYCVDILRTENSIFIASHDEIDEETENLKDKTIFITNSFQDFLELFVNGKLVSDYYDLEE